MISWLDLDSVLLDMDGTLLDLHFDNYFWQQFLVEQYAQHKGISVGNASAQLSRGSQDTQGKLEWYCVDYWSETLGLDIPALKLQVRHKIQLRPGALAFLGALQSLPCKVVLVTNAHPKALAIKLVASGIGQYFDRILSSHEFGLPKEDPAFWDLLQQEQPFDPSRSLFVDDTESVLLSARSHQITHLYGIAQPDSQGPQVSLSEFPVLAHFQDIMPQLAPSQELPFG